MQIALSCNQNWDESDGFELIDLRGQQGNFGGNLWALFRFEWELAYSNGPSEPSMSLLFHGIDSPLFCRPGSQGALESI